MLPNTIQTKNVEHVGNDKEKRLAWQMLSRNKEENQQLCKPVVRELARTVGASIQISKEICQRTLIPRASFQVNNRCF